MARPRDISRGGGKKWKAEVSGVAELKAKWADLASDLEGKKRGRAKEGTSEVLRSAAGIVKAEAKSRASSGGTPKRVERAIFSYYDPVKNPPKRPGSLVGVRTGAKPHFDPHIFKEWMPRAPKSKRATVQAGARVIGVSMARFWESGTSRGIRAVRYFSGAVKAARGKVLSALANGYKALIETYSDRK